MNNFYVLESSENQGEYFIDSQLLTTKNVLISEHYISNELAVKARNYFKNPQKWIVKKVTITIE